MSRLFVATLVVACLTASVAAQDDPSTGATGSPAPALVIGDPCPPLRVEAFLGGEPFAHFEEGRVYVVEFWATWCAPCRRAMPHLSALQARYRDRDVTVLGVNVRELRRVGNVFEEAFDDEARAAVEAFVRRQGDLMAYTVAYDGASKSMDHGWMQASGSEGLPTTFIVDRSGRVAWIGHPQVLRMPLHQIVEGTWDLESGPERVRRAEAAYLGAMGLFATDLEGGLAAWERASEEHPLLADDLIGPEFDALMAAGAREAATVVGERLLTWAVEARDPGPLNSLAWSLVDPSAVSEPQDLDLALRAATAANDLTHREQPAMLDTLARVHFLRGEFDEAVDVQSRAVEQAEEHERERFTPALDEYQRAREASAVSPIDRPARSL